MNPIKITGYTMYATGLTGAIADPSPTSAGQTPLAVWLALAGLLTTLINAVVADRKGKRDLEASIAQAKLENENEIVRVKNENDNKVAQAKLENDRQLAQAKAAADAKLALSAERIAALEARLAGDEETNEAVRKRRHEQIGGISELLNALRLHADGHSTAINELISAVAENSRRTGSPSPPIEPVTSPLDRKAWSTQAAAILPTTPKA